jgi:hypothetical protein
MRPRREAGPVCNGPTGKWGERYQRADGNRDQKLLIEAHLDPQNAK